MGNQRLLFKTIVTVPNLPELVDGDGDSLANDIILSQEDNTLVLTVTEQEYIRLLSAAFNGAITTYPEDYLNVIYPLIKAGKVSLCDAVLNCIEETEAIQSAIGNSSGGGSSASVPVTPSTSQSYANAIGDNGCDEDTVWGQSSKLVDFIHQTNVDFYENLNLISESTDKVEEWLSVIPALGAFVSAVINTVTDVGDALLSSYQASYNDALRDEIACAVFCIAVNNPDCSVTIQEVIDYLLQRYNLVAAPGNELNTLTTVATVARLGTVVAQGGGIAYSGDDMVYISFLVQLLAVSIANQYFNVTSIGTYYNEAYDSVPSPGWETECDDCVNTWCAEFDFALDDGGWEFHALDVTLIPTNYANGAWNEGYFRHASSSNRWRMLNLKKEVLTAVDITRVYIEYTSTAGNAGGARQAVEFRDGPTSEFADFGSQSAITGTSREWTGLTSLSNFLYIRALVGFTQNTDPGGTFVLTKVIVEGEGTNPWPEYECEE